MKTRTMLALLALCCAALPAADHVFRYGTGARFSSFGIPNALLDLALYEHPSLSGTAMTFEFHSYGEKGPKSTFSGIYSLEYSRITGEGHWRVENYDNRVFGSGEVTQVNVTATILMHIFPSSPIHPYIGGGIGIGRMSIWAEGSYQDELGTTIRDTYQKKTFVPVGHLPVGIMASIRDKVMIRAEAGFKNGFYFGGSAVINLGAEESAAPMAEIRIPDKLTFKRKEVMQLSKLDGRVLDYWEKEFGAFAPVVNQSGEKFYSRRDVEVILAVKQWLIIEKRDKGLIRDLLLQHFGDLAASQPATAAEPVNPEKLQKIRRGLKEILTLLAKDDKN